MTPQQENPLQLTVEAFAETVSVKLKQLRRFVPRKKKLTNSAVTGAFIEELVRGFIRSWIGHQLYLHGTIRAQRHIDAKEKPLQIDGIIYDPTFGPATMREGDFVVVHPLFCSGIIEVKMSYSKGLPKFEDRLVTLYDKYLAHRTRPSVMGVVIGHNDPESVSKVRIGDQDRKYYDHALANICPIFVLFKETTEGKFEPHLPAIEGLIRSIYNNLTITTRHIG